MKLHSVRILFSFKTHEILIWLLSKILFISEFTERITLSMYSASLVANCPRIMDRFPQKVLVGLAEVVSDSSSFSDCLMKCLNSQSLYKINCVSGEFYQTDVMKYLIQIFFDCLDEANFLRFDLQNSQQNCILNIMTRKTRPDLFTDEDKDTVDYFEPGCTGAPSSSSGSSTSGSRLSVLKGNGVRVKGG